MKYEKEWLYSFINHSNMIENINYGFQQTKNIIEQPEATIGAPLKIIKKENRSAAVWRHHDAIVHVLEKFDPLISGLDKPPRFKDALKIHELLMPGQLPPQYIGKVRNVGVYVGTYTAPPPGPRLKQVIKDFDKWLPKIEEKMSEEARYKLIYEAHVRYEMIHPFVDGNGRSGRLFWLALLNFYGFEFNEIDIDDRYTYYRSLQQRQNDPKYSIGGTYYGSGNLWFPPRPYKDA